VSTAVDAMLLSLHHDAVAIVYDAFCLLLLPLVDHSIFIFGHAVAITVSTCCAVATSMSVCCQPYCKLIVDFMYFFPVALAAITN